MHRWSTAVWWHAQILMLACWHISLWKCLRPTTNHADARFLCSSPSPTRPTPTLFHSSDRESNEMSRQHRSARGGDGGSRGAGELLPASDVSTHPQSLTYSSYAQLVRLPLKATTAATEDQWQQWLVSIRRAAAGIGACRPLGISGRQRAPAQGGPRRKYQSRLVLELTEGHMVTLWVLVLVRRRIDDHAPAPPRTGTKGAGQAKPLSWSS